MLQLLRKHNKKVLLGLLILIVPPFVFWGAGSSLKRSKNPTIGYVFGEKILLSDFLEQRDEVVIDLKMTMHDSWQNLDIEPLIWRYIILKKLSAQYNISVSKKEIADHISKLFGSGKDFNPNFYKTVVERNFGVSIYDFETLTRNRIQIDKLINLIANTTKISPEEVRQAYILKNTKLDFYTIRFKPEDYSKDISVDDKELADYFETNKDKYIIPTTRSVEYISFDPSALHDKIKITDNDVQSYYEENAEFFTDKDGNTKLLTDVREEIITILRPLKARNKLRNAVDRVFIQVADTLDLKKAADGIDFVDFGKTDLFHGSDLPEIAMDNPMFSKWAFSTDLDDISEPFRIGNTYFILKPVQEKLPSVPTLDEVIKVVRNDVLRMKSLETANDIAENTQNKISKLLGIKSNNFEDVCNELNIKPARTDSVTKEEAIIKGFSSGIVNSFFDTKPGNCGPVKFSKGTFVVFYIANRSFPDNDYIDKNIESFRQIYYQRKRSEVINGWYSSLLKRCTIYSLDDIIKTIHDEKKK
ncbi:MAG: peptidyl-prolyl cis-trans isomerase [Candidatus Theseobacter exili]|nr:peptidyl-prolyl cis-trans isomerase [Candidatus Theseobacter exili]